MTTGAQLFKVRDPLSTAGWRLHLRIMHGVWISPSAELAEMLDCHDQHTAAPGVLHTPHHHGSGIVYRETSDEIMEHGFW